MVLDSYTIWEKVFYEGILEEQKKEKMIIFKKRSDNLREGDVIDLRLLEDIEYYNYLHPYTRMYFLTKIGPLKYRVKVEIMKKLVDFY